MRGRDVRSRGDLRQDSRDPLGVANDPTSSILTQLGSLDLPDPVAPARDSRDRLTEIKELRAAFELASEIQWDLIHRRRANRRITVATALGWTRVALGISVVAAGFACTELALTGRLHPLSILHALASRL
jgi:hypothetical protein